MSSCSSSYSPVTITPLKKFSMLGLSTTRLEAKCYATDLYPQLPSADGFVDEILQFPRWRSLVWTSLLFYPWHLEVIKFRQHCLGNTVLLKMRHTRGHMTISFTALMLNFFTWLRLCNCKLLFFSFSEHCGNEIMYRARTCGMLLVRVTSEGSCDQLGVCQSTGVL